MVGSEETGEAREAESEAQAQRRRRPLGDSREHGRVVRPHSHEGGGVAGSLGTRSQQRANIASRPGRLPSTRRPCDGVLDTVERCGAPARKPRSQFRGLPAISASQPTQPETGRTRHPEVPPSACALDGGRVVGGAAHAPWDAEPLRAGECAPFFSFRLSQFLDQRPRGGRTGWGPRPRCVVSSAEHR